MSNTYKIVQSHLQMQRVILLWHLIVMCYTKKVLQMHVSLKKGVGFLTFALNTDVDYETCALLWALSLRASHKSKIQIAVVVNDKNTCRSELHDNDQSIVKAVCQ